MNSKVLLLSWVCAAAFCIALLWMWFCVLDTGANRKRVANQMQAIASRAEKEPGNIEHVTKLLRKAESRYSFEAVKATVALGTVGDAANPVIHDIAALMDSPNSVVRREASLALARLGERSAPVLPALKAKVANEGKSGDDVWFAARAIGEIGCPAIGCIPLLESKLGTGAPQFDNCLNEAIQKLRQAKKRCQCVSG